MPIFNLGMFSVPDSNDYTALDFLTGGDKSAYVSAKDALQNSDIYATVNLISGDLATSRILAPTKRMQGMINNPSSMSNGHLFWKSVFLQLLLGGEAFVYRWRNRNGVDLRWEYLRPSQVNVFELEDGSSLIYNVSFDEKNVGVVQAIPQSEMLHFRLASRNGGKTGISPLSSLSPELDVKKANTRLTLTALKQAIVSPGILTIKKGGLLNEKQKAARSRQFMRQQESSNYGPVVLDDLEEYKPLEIKSDISALLSQTDWTSKQIAKVYNIPDSYLNGQGDQQSSLDQIKEMYTTSLNRYMEVILSELNNKLGGGFKSDLRPAIDPLGDNYAKQISSLVKDHAIDSGQATFVLKNAGYFPDDLPEYVGEITKGGEN
ncbi:phage portal protein [Ligilactobacillus equi]